MNESELQPITMRFLPETIALIQQEARKLSFQRNMDISYVDLIRSCVEIYANDIKNNLPKESTDSDTNEINHSEIRFHNNFSDILKDLNIDDIKELLDIKPSSIQNKINESYHKKIRSLSLPMIVLNSEEDKKEDETETVHNFAAIPIVTNSPVLVLEGDSAHVIKDVKEIFPLPVQIAARPTLKISDLEHNRSSVFRRLSAITCESIAQCENSHLFFMLRASAYISKNIIEYTGGITENLIAKSYNAVNEQIQVKYMICHTLDYAEMRTYRGKDWDFSKVNNLDLMKGVGPKYSFGKYKDADILVSRYMNPGGILFSGDPKQLGNFKTALPLKTYPDRNIPNLKVGLVCFETIGMVITRPSLVSYLVPADYEDANLNKFIKETKSKNKTKRLVNQTIFGIPETFSPETKT